MAGCGGKVAPVVSSEPVQVWGALGVTYMTYELLTYIGLFTVTNSKLEEVFNYFKNL